ncbi:MAG: double-strand break repair helicase AddA [Pseudomonadota bacterium]
MSQALEAATALQRQALDPTATLWVEASAGSGKTKVLVDRCLRLLLDGTAPERLLCITYTKAAAAEMAGRLMQTLARWVALDQVQLEGALDGLLGRHPKPAESERARQLFALVLDTPGGLKVQTLHAFCQSVLSRFPLEAGVSPGFRALEERDAAALLAAARMDLVLEAERDQALQEALSGLLVAETELGLDSLTYLVSQERGALAPLLRDGRLPVLIRLAEVFDIALEATPEAIVTEGLADRVLPLRDLSLIAAGLSSGSPNEQRNSWIPDALRDAEPAERLRLFPDYVRLFLANKGADRAPRKRLLTKGAKDAVPEALTAMEREAERLLALEVRATAAAALRATDAALQLIETLLAAYERRKRRAAALDYQDLLEKTDALLQRPGLAAWVLYKLDGGLDHLLIDEAQDTSPLQWRIVTRLTEEFYGGEGSSQRPRTVFAVGDPKQSIYRFQGADPAGYQATAVHFAQAARDARQRFQTIALTHSFRSAPAVLQAVDAVFTAAEPLTKGPYAPHLPIRSQAGGLVQLRPRHLPETETQEPAWTPPVVQAPPQSPAADLAEEVATLIAGWLEAKDPQPGDPAWLAARGRPLQAGDILILVRRRDALFHLLARALERRGLPVAGVDRMLLTQQLAVQDLLALAQALLLPEDDLTLATVLKGPFCGLDEDSLFHLAHARSGSLWQALRDRHSEDPVWQQAYGELSSLRARLDFEPPFSLFAWILGAGGGRRRLAARLGEEVGDALDEFLALALAYEREEAPSLQGFLGWVQRSEVAVKRDLEAAGDKIRLMTVHGAKGLQAPVVLLPDSRARQTRRANSLIAPERGLFIQAVPEQERLALLASLLAERQAENEAEERRLLYVAMTRAEDRLYLLGHKAKHTKDEGWYGLLRDGMSRLCELPEVEAETEEEAEDPLLTHETPQAGPARPDRDEAGPAWRADPLPDWAWRPPQVEPEPARPLSPSRPSAEEPPALSPLAGQLRPGLTRGRLVHRLLQLLPELPAQGRAAAAARFLAQPAWGLSTALQTEIAEETLAVLSAPDAAPLFQPGSRAEVPIAGLVGKTRIAGQIDRLAVTEDALLLVDYKTNRPSPQRAEDVPQAYLRQLAAYRALLSGLYPDRPLRSFLLWTETARLMHITDEALSQVGGLTQGRA